jgi:hypothetical protein
MPRIYFAVVGKTVNNIQSLSANRTMRQYPFTAKVQSAHNADVISVCQILNFRRTTLTVKEAEMRTKCKLEKEQKLYAALMRCCIGSRHELEKQTSTSA